MSETMKEKVIPLVKRSFIQRSASIPQLEDWTHDKATKWFEDSKGHLIPLGGKPPKGLWYQVGTSWEDFCKGRNLDFLGPWKVRVEVDRRDFAILDSQDAIADFADTYGLPNSYLSQLGLFEIDWKRVMGEFSGVEMPNYNHEWSLFDPGCQWTYGWDCASGVCWAPTKRVRILDIEEREPSTPTI